MIDRYRVAILGVALWTAAAHAQTDVATTSPTSAATAAPAPAGSGCELHVFPTRNFIAMNTGMLSGFGVIGALVDAAAHKDKVKTVKELMSDYLTPEAQLASLNKIGLAATLQMPMDTQIMVEPPFPSPADVKQNPSLKAKLEEAQKTEKAGKRLTSSAAVCYAELAVPYVFYQKAAMYGTRVFTSFILRDFRKGEKALLTSKGQVENHVPNFPAADPSQEEAAKAALIDAYGQDLKKWADLKLRKS